MSFVNDDIEQINDKLVFNPYNPLNVQITLNEVQTILANYGLPPIVHNLDLYRRAFVHASYVKRPQKENELQNIVVLPCPHDCLPLRTKSNERLEYIGDGFVEATTKLYLYKRFPNEDEGFMTEKKIAIVKNESLGSIALSMGLNKWLLLSKHTEEKKTRTNLKKLGCLMEAFIGAIYLDWDDYVVHDTENWFQKMFRCGTGFQMAQLFILNVYEKHIDWTSLVQINDNYKNILQVKIQREFKITPHYIQMSYDDEKGYEMGVYICIGQPIYGVDIKDAVQLEKFEDIATIMERNDGNVFAFLGKGQHKIKKKAEQIACKMALLNTTTELVDNV
jgi:ribonuclease-3